MATISFADVNLSSLSRYYGLFAGCVFARKYEWFRKACLAITLLWPAVAAVHGIVLAAEHINGESLMLNE